MEQQQQLSKKIPMQEHTNMNGVTPYKVDVVNVTELQAMCLGLSSGLSGYDAIRELADQENKRLQLQASRLRGANSRNMIRENKCAGSDSITSRTRDGMSRRCSLSQQRSERKEKDA